MRTNHVPKDVSDRDPKCDWDRDLNYVRSHALHRDATFPEISGFPEISKKKKKKKKIIAIWQVGESGVCWHVFQKYACKTQQSLILETRHISV